MIRYVFLMRHADHEPSLASTGGRQLTSTGWKEVNGVGGRLREYLTHAHQHGAEVGIEPPRLGAVVAASTGEAKATASALVSKLQSAAKGVVRHDALFLSPDGYAWSSAYFYHWAYTSRSEVDRKIEKWAVKLLNIERSSGSNAILVVCHAPQIGWLASHLTGRSIPIARAELLCISVETSPRARRARLEWVLSPSIKDVNADQDADLKGKIKAKMESAKLLGAVLTGLLTFVISAPKELVPATPTNAAGSGTVRAGVWAACNPDLIGGYLLSLLLLIAGMFLFFTAYFAYDRLLMPSRFWAETRPSLVRPAWLVARPPGNASWVLYLNMMHIWTYRFIPAAACAVLAPTLLAYSMIAGRLWPGCVWSQRLGVFIAALALGSLIAWVYARWTQPVVGSED
jgi:phosphohistidine phosphatase SixA